MVEAAGIEPEKGGNPNRLTVRALRGKRLARKHLDPVAGFTPICPSLRQITPVLETSWRRRQREMLETDAGIVGDGRGNCPAARFWPGPGAPSPIYLQNSGPEPAQSSPGAPWPAGLREWHMLATASFLQSRQKAERRPNSPGGNNMASMCNYDTCVMYIYQHGRVDMKYVLCFTVTCSRIDR